MFGGRARAIADAILYEGYALYPYRASSLKNQRRWMLGSLAPRGAAEALGEPWRLRCACLLEAPGEAEIEGLARFLRFEARPGEAGEDATPEEVRVGPLGAGAIAARPHREPFSRAGVEGQVTLAAEPVAPGVVRLVVTVENLTPLGADAGAEGARRASLASAHALLAVRGGSFVSLLDPPPHLREAAEGCRNAGAWPVLAGAPGERDLVLCSSIILDDHPRVAPESPGDLFDATEMDEMLTLRILTMTDAEKREAAAEDGRVRALIARTEALAPEQIARLHGAVRSPRPRTVRAGGREIGPGDRVRLHPSGRSDILDLALEGEEATVASIEQDYEDRTFVTVTVDADPGRDFGERGLPGHRFFFRPDEVEPLGGDGGALMDAPRLLVAGIGNVFLGDDAFGVEVVARLRGRALPEGVRVVDFGIRGFDLALALERCDAAILVDAAARGGAPGTLYVLEPELGGDAGVPVSPHGITPDEVLRRLAPGARPRQVRIVGCEPESLGDHDGDEPAGLSAPVRAAVDEAVLVVERLVCEILRSEVASA